MPNKYAVLSTSSSNNWLNASFLGFTSAGLLIALLFYLRQSGISSAIWFIPSLYILAPAVLYYKKTIISPEFIIQISPLFLIFPVAGLMHTAHELTTSQLIFCHVPSFLVLHLELHVRFEESTKTTTVKLPSYLSAFLGVLLGLIVYAILVYWIQAVYIYAASLLMVSFWLPLSKKPCLNLWPLAILFFIILKIFFSGTVWFIWLKERYLIETLLFMGILFFPKSSVNFSLSLGLLFLYFFLPVPSQALSF